MGNSAERAEDSDLWRRHLFQQDKVAAHEDDVFAEIGVDFSSAKRVLDLGVGHGGWLASLAEKFGGPQYVGVDNDTIAVASALRDYSRTGVVFCSGNVETGDTTYADPGFDIAIARLLVQHLKAPEKFADHARALLRTGGQLLVIDGYEAFKRFHPDVPTYRRAFHNLRARQDTARCMSLLDFPKTLLGAGFEIRSERILAAYTGQNFSAEDFLEMCRLNIRVVDEHLGGVDSLDQALDELENWFAAPDRFASIGSYVLVAQKRAR